MGEYLDKSAHAKHKKSKSADANKEKVIREAELVIASIEEAQRKAELTIANKEKAKREAELVIANKEKAKREAELVIANKEKAKREAELVIANKEKAKREAELVIANKEKEKGEAELIIANEEKLKSASELLIANEDKAQGVAELVIANVLIAKREAELLILHIENAKRSSELAIAHKELAFHKKEKTKHSAELVTSNIEKAKNSAESIIANIEKVKRFAEIVLKSKTLMLSQEKEKLNKEISILNSELTKEIELRKQFVESLNVREEEFRSIAESMPQMVWTTRADGWNTYFNQQWVDYTGLTLEESSGYGWFTPFHPEDKEAAREEWQNAVNNNVEYSIECRLRRYDGTYHWWLIRGVPQLNAAGEIIMWYGTCTDIRKIKEAEHTLKEREKELLQHNSDKDLFISILGHDLRSPFNVLIGMSELLINNIRVHSIDKTEELLKNLKDASTDTLALLDDLLTWTTNKSGRMPFTPQILNFSDICENLLESLNINAKSKSITIKTSYSDNISVFADINMLKAVLRNLVSNAIKFTNKGGTIIINAEENSEYVTISVSDNGVGIYPERITNLFNISYKETTRGTEREYGTGLGLIICEEFIKKHGGKIWVESEVGKGSDFKFTLPVSRIQE